MKIRVLIADDHRIFRQGLRSLLESQPEVEVLGEAENGRALIKMARQFEPDLVILDVAMPEMNGIDAAHKLKELGIGTRILALSMHSDSRFVTQMLKAGADGYLLKDCAFNELTDAMQTVLQNRVYLSPGVTDLVVRAYLENAGDDGRNSTALTSREREILQLIAEGKNTLEIAGLLNISGKTVDTHRRQIMRKLDLHSVAELTKYAIREGITVLGN